ncbi:MMPL family transporter [Actinomyces urogenitalis]|uniref:MMPL family transporter n=1 Tax=Actinomyces urogenitalis TaxID=103621 RepID=UPI0018991FAD|nr:MMPL family transporter [Actinomyces urogenitalis]MDU0863294.1 MMPL family transporter [Actinomyces urogenitalis]MDU0873931.1 MMPL family transporter [Actinomyces urogenitalis]MDU1563433.1 MMPL family transporter [Actinomyces urogenitalis]MDU1638800.1 MMPL family transporter [Actinomyces urogenitalis]MDU6776550.1 MMPL family transporter [Actinomyces urogenitalis]
MLTWLARRLLKDAWIVVAVWAALAAVLMVLALTGLGGKGLFDRLETDAATIGGTQSAQGEEIISTLTGDAQTVSLLVTGVDISQATTQQAVATALEPVHKELGSLVGQTNVLDPFVVPGMLDQPAARVLASKDLDGFLLVVTVDPNGEEVSSPDDQEYQEKVADMVEQVEARLAQVPGELRSVSATAQGIVSDDHLMSAAVSQQVESDLVRGEMIALPVTLVVMVLVFGGFLAAGMPILGALSSIAGSFGVLWIASTLVDLQSFVVNIVTVIGLGLSIDYALLITSRYREELAQPAQVPQESAGAGQARRNRRRSRRSGPVAQALTTTITTAGRTVLFSGLTVAISLFSLLLMGTDVLRSIAVASIAVVLIAVAAALTLVPAVLVLAGERLARPSPLGRLPVLGTLQRHLGDVTRQEGFFSRLARAVHRVPWLVLGACLLILVALALPVRGTHLLTSTTELLPSASPQRTYLTVLQEDYPATQQQDATLIIAATGQEVTTFINDQVAAAPGVDSVLQSATAGQYTVVYLDLAGDGTQASSERAVQAVRDLAAPADTWVTGQAASQLDFRSAVLDGLPWVVAVIALATFVLLFLMTGSVLVPFKALVINALSLAASIGVLVWVFQEGHLTGLLGFTPIGGVEAYVVVTAVGVGFGLAMDYEVFILARIKEYWDAGCDNDTAVERGLQHSGRIVTSAALIMVLVFLGFVGGDLLIIKQVGLALAVIVALDATLVRMLLVPATMTLLGRWNWWAPEPMRRLYERYGIRH